LSAVIIGGSIIIAALIFVLYFVFTSYQNPVNNQITETNPEKTNNPETPPPEVTNELIPEFDITTRPDGPPIDDYEGYLSFMTQYTNPEEKYLKQRWDRCQQARAHFVPPDLTIQRVIEAFLRTPREYFCREQNLSIAYEVAAPPIGYGQTISGPNIVCRMTNAINPQPYHKVLEIGTGSGYQAAFLSELSNFVYTIEIIPGLAEETDDIYKALEIIYPQYKNVKRKTDDGYYGWPEYAPFDRIIVTCGIDHIPPPLLQQLAPDGIMVIPVGAAWSIQKILKITKLALEDGTFTLVQEDLYEGTGIEGDVFVPFTADEGSEYHTKERDNIQE
jgi:protein-L-isoaspartate(D-aspartate) O-methyltransferase